MTKYQILTLNQISSHGLHRFPSTHYAVGKAVARARRDPRALARHARDDDSREREGDRQGGRGHQQHPGGGAVEARRARVQCAGRQRERRQGARAGCAVAGRAQRASGALACRRPRPGCARSRKARRRRQEAVRRRRASAPHARHRRPRRHRQPRRRHGDQDGHEGDRLRSGDHGRRGVAPAVERSPRARASRSS